MSAAQNIVDFVRGFGERKRAADIRGRLKNYLTDPEGTIAAVNEIDAPTAINLNAQHINEVQQARTIEQAGQKRSLDNFTQITGYLRSARDNGQTDIGAALDGLAPFIKSTLGADDSQIAQYRQALTANPALLDALDAEGQKAKAKLAGDVTVAGPGSVPIIGGKMQPQVPFAPKVLAVPNASGGKDVVTVDPNRNPGAPGAGGGAALTVEALRPHFVAQESGGDYKAINPKSGTLGAYQLKPETAAALAKRLGLAYRPDMLTKDDEASRRYQDALGGAAIQEAIQAGGGDPTKTFQYYYGGSDASKYGPRTRQYAQEMNARIGAAAPAAGGNAEVAYSSTGAPKPSKAVTNATPEELAAAGYAPGTAAQKDANGRFVNIKTPSASTTNATVKQQQLELSQRKTAQSTAENLDRLGKYADGLLNDKALDSAVGNIYGRIPTGLLGQGAVDFEKKLINLKQNIGLTALQQFKSLSATGASGFGNLSNEEGRRLESLFGTLDRASSPTLIRQTLKDITQFVRDHNTSIKAGLADKGGAAPAPNAAPAVGTKAYKRDAKGNITATIQWNGRGWVPVRN